MSPDFVGGFVVGGGIAALIAWNAGIREGMARAARRWSNRRTA